MKALIKWVLRRAGCVVATSGHLSARYIDYPPRCVLDEILLRLFPTPVGLNFIQVGAHDGVRVDPIHHSIRTWGWSGLLVEPIPALFEALRRNYAGQPGLSFLNAAIDEVSGERLMYRVSPMQPDVPDWLHGVIGFDIDQVRQLTRTCDVPDDAIVTESVRTVTWQDVRAAFGPRHCDVLVMDVEGFDVTLLRLANLSEMRPTVIQFEHSCANRTDRLNFYGELGDLGYEISTCVPDTIAYLAPPPAGNAPCP